MKDLDFEPSKSKKEFHKNYKLHDLAEWHGKNLLAQWGIEYSEFGKDNRFEKVWEKGEDKPDGIIEYKGKSAFIDWKGKHKAGWLVNNRAVKAYEKWSSEFKIPVFIAFFLFDEKNILRQKRFAFLGKHNYFVSKDKQWDKNLTVEFENNLPEFDKAEILNFLLHKQ